MKIIFYVNLKSHGGSYAGGEKSWELRSMEKESLGISLDGKRIHGIFVGENSTRDLVIIWEE